MVPPLAAAATWPNGADWPALGLFGAIALGLPALGYVFLAIDVRRYLRSLRRALAVIVQAPTTVPYWVLRDRPPCLETFGVDAHCSEEQLWAAYRERVKDAHPDRGGDLQQFLRIQKHFEQSLHLVRQRAARRQRR
ncbi:MAG: hypothetical protein KF688_10690 [Pirellulales bacterium]|nr:hypothetical protein [Pirellulales bacterium]